MNNSLLLKKTQKVLALAAMLCASVGAGAESVTMLTFGIGAPAIEEPQMMGLAMSRNGNYVCGSIENGAGYFVADLTSKSAQFVVSEDDLGAELRGISDTGKAVGYNGPGIIYSLADGEQAITNFPEGNKRVIGEGITCDNSLIVGSLVGAGYITHAAISENGAEWTKLPMPSDEEIGGFAGKGSSAKFVSGDGSIIAGHIGSFGPLVVWRRDASGVYTVDPVYKRFVGTNSISSMLAMGVSANGKYVLCRTLLEEGDSERQTVGVYNTETDQFNVYSEPQQIDEYCVGLMPSGIANDGTVIGIVGQPLYGSSGTFIIQPGETQAKKLIEVFPEFAKVFGPSDSVGYNVPTGISADGKRISGYAFYSEDFSNEESIAYFTTYVIDSGASNLVETIAMPRASMIFDINGRRLKEAAPGLNIVVDENGRASKVIK